MCPKYRPLAYVLLISILSSLTGYYLGATLALLHNSSPDSRLRSFAAPALKGSIND